MPTTPTYKTDGGGKKKRPNQSVNKGFREIDSGVTSRPFMPVSNAASEAGRAYIEALRPPAPPVPTGYQGPTPPPGWSPSTTGGGGTGGRGTGGGGTGVGTGTGTGTGAPGTPMEGFASRYAPGYAGELWNNPDVLAADVLAQFGITNPEMIGLMGDQALADFAISYIMQAGGPNSMDLSQGDVINYIANLLTQSATPGGNELTMSDIVGALMGADPSSILGADLAGSTDPDEINKMLQLAASATMNPYYQRGLEKALGASKRQYYQDLTTGGMGTDAAGGYYDAIKSGKYGGWFGGGQ